MPDFPYPVISPVLGDPPRARPPFATRPAPVLRPGTPADPPPAPVTPTLIGRPVEPFPRSGPVAGPETPEGPGFVPPNQPTGGLAPPMTPEGPGFFPTLIGFIKGLRRRRDYMTTNEGR